MPTLGDFPAMQEASARLAACLRQEREDRGWSQAEMAGRSGVSKAAISKIERGETSPTATVLVRLASAYGLTLAGLLLRAEGGGQDRGGRLSRVAEQPRWRDPATGYERQQVFMRADHPLEVVHVTLPAQQEVKLPAASYARIRQLVRVETGVLTVQEGPDTHTLHPGDALAFGPPQDVILSNPTAQPCTYLVCLTRTDTPRS